MISRKLRDVLRLLHQSPPEVVMILEYALCNNVATSLWLFMAWAPWVFTVFGQRTSVVGELAAINGLFEILGAAGGGTIADKQWWGITRRHAVQLAMCIGLLSMVLHVVGIVVRSLSVLVVAQAVFGTFLGASMSSVEALMADCVEGGKRDGIYSLKYFLEMSGPLVGCGVSVLLFAVVGNTFTESILTSATLTGILVHCVSMLRLLVRLPSHDAAIISATVAQQKEKETVDAASGGGDAGGGDRSRLARFADMSGCCSSTADLIMAEEDRRLTIDEDEQWEECVVVAATTTTRCVIPDCFFHDVGSAVSFCRSGSRERNSTSESSFGRSKFTAAGGGSRKKLITFFFCFPPPVLSHSALPTVPRFPGCLSALLTIQRIPYICAAHDIILTAGSGLTTMYFSLFMIEEYNISPIVLAVLQGACGLATGALVALCGKLGPLYGRTQTVTVIKFIGAWLTLLPGRAPARHPGGPRHAPLRLTVWFDELLQWAVSVAANGPRAPVPTGALECRGVCCECQLVWDEYCRGLRGGGLRLPNRISYDICLSYGGGGRLGACNTDGRSVGEATQQQDGRRGRGRGSFPA
jgi:hypothetical protein